jgi:hypothetical protein
VLAAMQTISNANPSAANPWLLKLEPGNYDLGNQSLTLLPYVDLEGSGEGTTTISSTVGMPSSPNPILVLGGTVVMSTSTEVRFVTLSNTGSNGFQTALTVPTGADNARITHVTTSVTGGTNNYGVNNVSNSPVTIANSTLTAYGSSQNLGLGNFPRSNALLTVQDSVISATGGTFNAGIFVSGVDNTNIFPQVLVQNSSIAASTGRGIGIIASHSILSITNSTLAARGINGDAYGIESTNSALALQGSKVTASDGNNNWGILFNLPISPPNNAAFFAINNSIVTSLGGTNSYGLTTSGPVSASVQNSVVGASNASSENYTFASAGSFKIGASQLFGASGLVRPGTTPGPLICVASYDANFAPLNSNCTTGP